MVGAGCIGGVFDVVLLDGKPQKQREKGIDTTTIGIRMNE
jgi:hypothetical protein